MDVDTKLIIRYAIRETMGVVIVGVALFWSAGRMDWWPAWVLVLVTAAWVLATAIAILRLNPDLLAERLGPREGAKTWDTVIMSIVGVSQLARLVIAGLDQRFGWTGGFPLAAQVAAVGISALGYALVVWATGANAYFSQITRIQTEREHSVTSRGPYRWVRHPAYVGSILFELAVPILLDSWWALIPGGLNAVLFAVRTALEDRTLKAELPGYVEYANEVEYRLLPGIW